uniref:WAP four-disulfide core domain protein 1 n=1 Tax=Catagonus wagneri TaxID=51154 RepID=A0A8C3YGF9_9CETA
MRRLREAQRLARGAQLAGAGLRSILGPAPGGSPAPLTPPSLPQAEEAGGARQPRADRCPPPPRSLPPGACQATRCQADSECPRHRRCCYNGCAYACLEAVPPPPVLDWLVQPKPRWLGGNGWLLDGPEETLQAEACSTTEDGAEPLLCPSGYECHILSPGDAAEGIPNRGQCVKQRRPAEKSGTKKGEFPWWPSRMGDSYGTNFTKNIQRVPPRMWQNTGRDNRGTLSKATSAAHPREHSSTFC